MQIQKKWKIRKGSFGYFFTIFFTLLFIPVLIFCSSYYISLNKQVKGEIEQYHQETLRDIQSTIDRVLSDLELLSVKLSNSQWVNEITYMQTNYIDRKRVSSKEITNYIEELRNYEVLNPLAVSISILFIDKNYVISSHGISRGDTFYNELFECKGINYQFIVQTSQSSNNHVSLFTENLKINTLVRDGRSMGRSLVYLFPLNTNRINRSVMVVYVPIMYIEQMIVDRLEGSANTISAFNDDMELIVEAPTINESMRRANEIISKSDFNQWHYTMSIPYHDYTNARQGITAGISLISMLLLLIIIFMAIFLSDHQVAPLREVFGLIAENSNINDNHITNIDYYKLKNIINLMVYNDKLLKEENKTMQPIIWNEILLKLLYGISLEREMKLVTNICTSLFKYPKYTVCLFVYDKYIELEKLKNDIDQVHIEWISYCVEVGDMTTAIILNHNHMDWINNYIADIDYIIEENHASYYGTLLVGGTYNGINNIQKAYIEARQLLEYRVLNVGDGDTVIYYDEILKEKNIVYYPIHIELKIISALKEGDMASVELLLDEIIDHNRNDEGLVLGNARLLAYNLMTTAQRAMEFTNHDENYFIDYRRIENFTTSEAILEYIRLVYIDIMERISVKNNDLNSDLISIIDGFLEDNYSIQNMSLSLLSAYVGKPDYYLSRFFKKQYGKNFLEYLHLMRLNKAKKLLCEGYTIRDVAEQTGYSSDITFRRTFKKYEGINPNEYKNISHS